MCACVGLCLRIECNAQWKFVKSKHVACTLILILVFVCVSKVVNGLECGYAMSKHFVLNISVSFDLVRLSIHYHQNRLFLLFLGVYIITFELIFTPHIACKNIHIFELLLYLSLRQGTAIKGDIFKYHGR